jgi:hypothetical protein
MKFLVQVILSKFVIEIFKEQPAIFRDPEASL